MKNNEEQYIGPLSLLKVGWRNYSIEFSKQLKISLEWSNEGGSFKELLNKRNKEDIGYWPLLFASIAILLIALAGLFIEIFV